MYSCSIIIPTHNRPKLLQRSIKYYEENLFNNFKIIIVDSSKKKFEYKFKKNFFYKFLKNNSFSSKIFVAIKDSKTKFVILCNDDDFISFSGLKKGINFLNKNKKYSSYQGEFISFRKLEKLNLITFLGAYVDTLKYNLNFNQKKKLDRIDSIYLKRPHWYNALHYRTNLKKSFEIAKKGKNIHFSEIIIPLIIGSKGFVKNSNYFWYAKDSNVYKSVEVVAQDKHKKMLEEITNYKTNIRKEVDKFMVNEFSYNHSKLRPKFDNIILKYFDKYLFERKNNYKYSFLSNLRKIITSIIPLFLKNLIRIIINLLKNRSPQNSGPNKNYGPLKNSKSSDDWNLMKRYIYHFSEKYDYKSIYKKW
jgi:glycosyltransferase domain-containing protein